MSFVTEKIEPGIVDLNVVDDSAVGLTAGDGTGTDGSTVASALARLRIDVNTAISQGTNRPISNSFVTFRQSLTLNNANLPLYNGISALYTATANQNIFVNLPTDQNIADAAIPYPIRLEFTHLGGTSRGLDNVMIINAVDGEEGIVTRSNGLQRFSTLHVTDGTLLEKADADSPWSETRFAVDPSETVLPTGLFTLRQDIVITDVTQIATELNGVTIARGDAFLVEGGGGYFGTTIADGDVIVAEEANPSLLTSSTGWLIVRNTNNASTTTANLLLLSNFLRDGNRFTSNRNVLIDVINVLESEFDAVGTLPSDETYTIPRRRDGITTYAIELNAPAITFPDLIGGLLQIDVQFLENQSEGFLPVFDTLVLAWDSPAISFSFNIAQVAASNGRAVISVEIPNVDYSGIIGTPPDSMTLNLDWNGVTYIGRVLVHSLKNTLLGPLHTAIRNIALVEANNALQATTAALSRLQGEASANANTFTLIEPRLSPLRTRFTEQADVEDVFYLDTTPGSGAPTDLTGFTRSDPDHASFEMAGTDVFLAIAQQHEHILDNQDSGQQVILSQASAQVEASLDLEASLSATVDGRLQSFFIYRYTATLGDVIRVLERSTRQVIAWQDDIDNLNAAISEIKTQLATNPMLNLPSALQSWLANDVDIIQQETTTLVPTAFNQGLGQGQQAFFPEVNTPAEGLGQQDSDAIANSPAPRRGRKVVYAPMNDVFSTMVRAERPLGIIGQTLVRREGNRVVAVRRVPATPATARNVTRYPLPLGRVQQDWFLLSGHTAADQALDTELGFVTNLPPLSSPATVTVFYRPVGNGNVGPEASFTVANVGGASDVSASATLILATGNTVTVTGRWRASQRVFEVEFSPNAPNNFFIFDYQTRVEWTENVTTPARPQSTDQVFLGFYSEGDVMPLLFAPSNALRVDSDDSTLLIAGPEGQVDTGFPFTELFNNIDNGFLAVLQSTVDQVPTDIYDYEIATLNQTLATILDENKSLIDRGLFTEDHDALTVASIDTQVRAVDDKDNAIDLGQDLILESPDGTKYRVQVADGGALSSTVVP